MLTPATLTSANLFTSPSGRLITLSPPDLASGVGLNMEGLDLPHLRSPSLLTLSLLQLWSPCPPATEGVPAATAAAAALPSCSVLSRYQVWGFSSCAGTTIPVTVWQVSSCALVVRVEEHVDKNEGKSRGSVVYVSARWVDAVVNQRYNSRAQQKRRTRFDFKDVWSRLTLNTRRLILGRLGVEQ